MLWLRSRSNAIWCSVVNVSPKNADEATDDYDEQKKAAILDNSTEDYGEDGNRINSKMLEWLWGCRTLILS